LIGYLRGSLRDKKPDVLVLDVHGVGYRLHIPLSTFYPLPDPGADVELLVHTHVRDDQITLFGFGRQDELDIFRAIISVRGCGPRIALTVLSGMEPEAVLESLTSGDAARLATVPGIGKKTAERLIYELKEKLSRYLTTRPGASPAAEGQPPPPELADDLLSALVNLGYPKAQAEKAVQQAYREQPEAAFEILLRKSLRQLMKR
jgi:Holliday junction DNA helicase RuvA